jgi:hypothetical protein
MSTQTVQLNNGQQANIKTDISKTFLWNNRFEAAQYTNGGGAPVTLAEGTLLGRISGTGKVLPLASAAVDGSALPVGLLNEDKTIAAGATIDLYMCVQGDVASEKIIFQGADTIDTVVSGRRLRDHLQAQGIRPVAAADELTAYDNE